MHPMISFVIATICAIIALTKNRSMIMWFFLGFFFQYFALLFLIILPSARSNRRHNYNSSTYYLRCPHCNNRVELSNRRAYGEYHCSNCQNSFVYGQEHTNSHNHNQKQKHRQSSSMTNNNDFDLDKAYQVLDSKRSDSFSEIKKKYREKAAKFHPDKIKGKDLPDEYQEFANQKFIEVRKAYETIKNQH